MQTGMAELLDQLSGRIGDAILFAIKAHNEAGDYEDSPAA